jgi:hypothetical protein
MIPLLSSAESRCGVCAEDSFQPHAADEDDVAGETDDAADWRWRIKLEHEAAPDIAACR